MATKYQTPTIKLTSWNITGVKYNLGFLRKCLANCDILCLQEHWLYPDNISFLDSINPNFSSWGRCANNLNLDSISRRGNGGIAFLWKKCMNVSIETFTDLGDDRIAVLKVNLVDGGQMYIVNVYLPTAAENAATYNRSLETLENILYELHGSGTVYIAGDFNAHIGTFGGPKSFKEVNCRGRKIGKIMDDFDLISVNSQNECKGPIETFYSNCGLTKTTTDHILVHRDATSFILYSAVTTDCSTNMSYHLAVSCVIKVNLATKNPNFSTKQFLWYKMKDQKYQDELAAALGDDPLISSEARTPEIIEELVVNTVRNLKSAANKTVPTKDFKPIRKHYWSPTLTSALNRKVKLCWRKWSHEGKPRDNRKQSFIDYKSAKRNFRKAQHQAVSNNWKGNMT